MPQICARDDGKRVSELIVKIQQRILVGACLVELPQLRLEQIAIEVIDRRDPAPRPEL